MKVQSSLLVQYLTCASVMAIAQAAFAQAPVTGAPPPAGATPPSGTSAAVGEIIVTAEKREQNLQRVAGEVEAVAPDSLVRANVNDFTDITKVVPNMTVTQAAGQTALEIRGIVTGSHDPTDESPNAVHIDGNYLARQNVINGLFYDIQRLEVVPGPQGTLYGRNAAGGAVNIITNKPTFDSYHGQGSLEIGNYDLERFEAAVNGPINDQLAVRIAGLSYSHDGYYSNGLDDANEQGARVEMLWKPSDRQSLLLTADFEKFSPKGQADNVIYAYQGALVTVPSLRNNTMVPAANFLTTAPGSGSAPIGYYGSGQRSFEDIETQAGSLQYDYNFDWATLTVQYAHRRMSQQFQDYGTGALTNTPEDSNTDTAEVRLTSASTRPFQWVIGYNYFDEAAFGAQQTYTNITATTFVSRAVLDDHTDADAIFGEASYRPPALDNLKLTLGGRFNYDHKTGSDDVQIVPLGTNDANTNVGKSWTDFSYKAGVEYDLTPMNMVYANTATGYKAGGVAFGPFPIVPPETNTAYEVGTKNRFFDGRLQVNLDAFHYKFTNPEFLTAATTVYNNTNISTLEVITADYETMYGAELDSVLALTPNDRFTLTADWLHARIHDLDYANPAYHVAGGLNLMNIPLFNAPDWTGRFSYDHGFDAFGGHWDGVASVFYIDKHPISYPTAFTGLSASPAPSIQALAPTLQGTVAPGAESPAATILDLSLRYAPAGAKWTVTVYVDNVTNDWYLVQGSRVTSGTSPLFNTVIGDPSPPRTYGMIVGVKF